MLKRIIKPLSQSGQTIPEVNSGKNNLYIDMRALNIIHIEMIVCLYFCDICFTHATCPCSEIYLLYIEAISLKLKLKVCQNKKDILLQLLHTFTLANVDAAEHRTLTNRLKRVENFLAMTSCN